MPSEIRREAALETLTNAMEYLRPRAETDEAEQTSGEFEARTILGMCRDLIVEQQYQEPDWDTIRKERMGF